MSLPILTLDLGGTKTICGVAVKKSGRWRIVNAVTEPTDHNGRAATVAQVVRLVRAQTTKPRSVHIAIAASITPNGELFNAPNINPQLSGFNLHVALQKILRCPVTTINDVRAFTLAEATCGAGKKQALVFGIMLGTGVGGGIAYRGKLLRGRRGFSGSIGHTVISDSPRRCGLGHAGDVEALCSGSGIEREYHRLTKRRRLATDILRAGEAGHGPAASIRRDAVAGLAIALFNISTLLDPDVIVIGGGLLRYRPYLREAQKVFASSLAASRKQPTPVHLAALGDHATMIGAVIHGLAK